MHYKNNNHEAQYQDCYGVFIKIQDLIDSFTESLTVLVSAHGHWCLSEDCIDVFSAVAKSTEAHRAATWSDRRGESFESVWPREFLDYWDDAFEHHPIFVAIHTRRLPSEDLSQRLPATNVLSGTILSCLRRVQHDNVCSASHLVLRCSTLLCSQFQSSPSV